MSELGKLILYNVMWFVGWGLVVAANWMETLVDNPGKPISFGPFGWAVALTVLYVVGVVARVTALASRAQGLLQ